MQISPFVKGCGKGFNSPVYPLPHRPPFFPPSSCIIHSVSEGTNPIRLGDYLPTSILAIVVGGGGFLWVITQTEPSGGTRWLFFFTAVIAISGLALPFVALLNRRFPSLPPPTQMVIVRQALWVGIYIPLLLWLRLGRIINLSLAILLAAGFILIETLLRLRERSQWKPPRS